jgi:hypothetical protein
MAVNKTATSDAGVARTPATTVPTQGDLTITAWLRYNSGRDDLQGAISVNDGSSTGFSVGMQNGAGYYPAIRRNASTTVSGSSPTDGSASTWYFCGFVYTHSTTTWEFFRGTEGGAVSSQGTANSSGWGTWWPTGANRRLYVGNGVGGFGPFYANGQMAYPRVWTAALSSAEVESERLKKSAVRTSNLWLELEFDAASDAGLITPAANGTITTNLTYASGSASDWTTVSDPTGLTDGASGVAKQARFYSMLRSA